MENLQSNALELVRIEDLLNHAWQNAIKYRYDPVAGRIHEEYLQMLKNIKKEIEEKGTICR